MIGGRDMRSNCKHEIEELPLIINPEVREGVIINI